MSSFNRPSGLASYTLSATVAVKLHTAREEAAVGFQVYYPAELTGVAQSGNVIVVLVTAGATAPVKADVLAGTAAACYELAPGQTLETGARSSCDVYAVPRSGTPKVIAGDLI